MELIMGKSLSIFKLGSSIRHYLHLHYEYISKEELEVYSDTYFFQSFSLNIGQVMFQGNILSGLFFLLAILINSRINAFYTVIAAALPLLIGLFPNIDLTAWNIGLFGYNGVLCAIALGDYTHKGNVKVILSVILDRKSVV